MSDVVYKQVVSAQRLKTSLRDIIPLNNGNPTEKHGQKSFRGEVVTTQTQERKSTNRMRKREYYS